MRARTSNFLVLFISLSTALANASGDGIALEPTAEVGSYAGQALDVKNNLAAVGQKVSGSYAVCFYEHTRSGWALAQTTTIGSRRAVSVAFGNDFLGIALSGTGHAGVVLEPTKSGWQLTSELPNPDPARFNSFSLAAASDNAIFITCNDSDQQYRDTVLVYERGSKGWQHVQTIAPWSASCTLFGQDIDASGDMLVIGATPVLGCSGGNVHGAYVYLRGTEHWEYLTAIQSGDTNGKWVACDGETVVSWCSITGPNSTFDYLKTWLLTGTSFQSTGSISSNDWGFDIYFPEGMQIAEGVITFGTCEGYWGCQTNTTTNRTVYTSQRIGNYWQLGIPVTIPSGYGSTGFGRNVKMGGGSLLVGAPAYSSSKGVVFQTPLAATLPCPADLNSDGVVNVSDILHIISEWGKTGRADLNGDSVINVTDFLWLLDAWGVC